MESLANGAARGKGSGQCGARVMECPYLQLSEKSDAGVLVWEEPWRGVGVLGASWVFSDSTARDGVWLCSGVSGCSGSAVDVGRSRGSCCPSTVPAVTKALPKLFCSLRYLLFRLLLQLEALKGSEFDGVSLPDGR